MNENEKHRFIMSFVAVGIGVIYAWAGGPLYAALFWYMSGYLLGSSDPEKQNWDAFNPEEPTP